MEGGARQAPDRAPPRGGGLVERGRGGQQPEADDGPDFAAPRDLDEMHRGFDRLFERFERDFGIDIPRRRFFDDTFFRDLKSQLKDGAQSQGMSIQIGPDGVRVEVQEEGENGKLEQKVYEAPDMETFRAQYPDVLQQNGLGMGLDALRFDMDHIGGRSGPIQRGFDWQLLEPHVRLDPAQPRGPAVAQPVSPVPPEGRRLGVLVKDVPPAVREYLDLGEVGLMVQEVQPGTLAEALGLAPDDIVVRIGEHDIASPADVQQALGAIDVGKPVHVEYVRKGRRQTAETNKRKAAAPEREVLRPRRAETGAEKVR